MQNPDIDTETANDDLAPALDCPAIRTVFEILETLEDLRILFGMQYDADQMQIDGKRMMFVNVWPTNDENNTHLSEDCPGWKSGFIQPIVSSTTRIVEGHRLPDHGSVQFDDDKQDDLRRLLGLLQSLRFDQVLDTYVPF